jgi:peptidoglycan hydrolase-like protein with peptidoglycan-binding domain
MATAPSAILTQLHALPRPEQWSGTVGYSPKTGKGTKNGDSNAVGIVQRALCLNGLDKIVGAVDSKFGKKTLLAIRTFQQQAHLSVDGIVGRITWKRLWEGTSFVVSGAGVNSAPTQAELAAINIPVAGGPTLPTAQPQTTSDVLGGWRWPLESNRIRNSANMPWPKNVYPGTRTENGHPRFHSGWDLFAEENTPCYAVDDGVVALIGFQAGGFGNRLVIKLDHPNGEAKYALYGHLHNFANGLALGSRVKKGYIVGNAGHTGNANSNNNGITGGNQHLHFELKRALGYSNPQNCVNPMSVYGNPPVNPVLDPPPVPPVTL